MLKFIKHNMDTIDSVEIWPIISLSIFFSLFVIVLWRVFRMKKEKVDEISHLPLED